MCEPGSNAAIGYIYGETISKPKRVMGELVLEKEDEDAELLSGVAEYLKERTIEISNALQNLNTEEPFLYGYRTGLLSGLELAEELIGIMSDRAAKGGALWSDSGR